MSSVRGDHAPDDVDLDGLDTGATVTAVGDARASISVLGPLLVRVRGEAVLPSAGRQRRLIAILAANATRAETMRAEELIDALYGEAAPPTARRALTTELWRLRRLLGTRAVRTDTSGYRLDPRHCAVDLVTFETRLTAGRDRLRDGALADAERSLAAALELWRGDPLPDWSDHTVGRATALRLAELHLGGIEDHAEALAATGRHAEALDALEALTTLEPTREHAWALMIESLLALGRARKARRAVDSARRHLAEHGVEIGAELRTASQRLRTTSQSRAPALVGRERETEALIAAVTDVVRSGCCGAVVVTGEAGIGKSALVDAAAAALGANLTIARIGCDPRLDLPYAALVPLLAGAGSPGASPALDRLLDGGVQAQASDVDETADGAVLRRSVLHESIAVAVEAAARAADGLLVIVEDAHWATAATLDALVNLIARRSPVPLCLLVTIRDPAADVAAPLGELRRRAHRILGLTGLDEAATAVLLGPAGDDPSAARRAHRLTGGNPLYVRQLAWLDLRVSGPAARRASLDNAVAEHVATLPDDVAAVLEIAAVAGERFDVPVLTAAASMLGFATSQVADALAAAATAGIVSAGNTDQPVGEFGFVHALIRDHLYARVPAQRRARAHAAIGDALARVSIGAQPPADLLAHHLFHGWPECPAARAAGALRAAGDRAADQLDFVRAGEFYRRALELIGMEPDFDEHDLAADLLVARAQAARAAGDLTGAHATYASLARLAITHQLPDALLRARLGRALAVPGGRVDHEAADNLVAAVQERLAGGATASARERSLLGESIAAIYPYRPHSGRALLERVIATCPDIAAPVAARVWGEQSVADQLATARALTDDPGADRVGSWLRLWVSEVAAGTRRLDAAPEQIAGALAGRRSRAELTLWRITAATGSGEFARADRLIAAALRRLDRADGPADAAQRAAALRGQRGWLALLRGDVAAAAEGSADNPAAWSRRPAAARAIGAYVHVIFGRQAEASPVVEELVDELLDDDMPEGDRLARTAILADACIRLRNRRGIDACRVALARHEARHAVLPFVYYLGAVSHHLGRLAAAVGDLDDAITQLGCAITAHQQVGAQVYEAQSRHNLALALWRRGRAGDRGAANTEHECAQALAAVLGLGMIAQRSWPPDSTR